MNELLEREYWNNTVQDYLIALAIIVVGTLALRIFKGTLLRRLEKWANTTKTTNDDFLLKSVERFALPALYYFIIYSGINYLELTPKADNVLRIATALVITFFILRLISSIILLVLQNYIRRQEKGEEKIRQLGGLMVIINIVVWILGAVFLIDNLGYNVTTIITGLGIGGIAIALAAQNILGDLFNYFVIFFDRPFEVGDFIVVDDKMGSGEYIGLKTTRIRSLSGEQLVIGNSNLMNARIHNFKTQNLRRVVFNINISYATPIEKVREIPAILKAIVEAQADVRFDRAHFASYKDWSLNFEIVYFVLSSDFNKYMDIQQSINLAIYDRLQALGVDFALPTQRLMMKGGGEEALNPNEATDKTEAART
ncbi:mechanosensitive ion channel family protein [Parachryseolinea silvisoli]|uniref:mechanosensitive ion channel family protein n=1 Tax=Parachryseolinea silvisoli TaxID=2873601 RepID=UPI002265A86B|nr:mechanosensitive ion channel family protein [Parachryseolinea silvisoli]MCD9016508.1 mechanosensitive ion channel family protein [Parachryseolinea silvisoli]